MKISRVILVVMVFLALSCSESKNGNDEQSEDVGEVHSDSSLQEDKSSIKKDDQAKSWPRKFYEGEIDGKYKIYASLKSDKGTLSGKYYYDSQRKLLDISGSQKGDSLFLKESYKSKITGRWDVKMAGLTVIGEWKNKNKQFSLEMWELADSVTFYSILNESKSKKPKAESFEKFISWFDSQELPFTVDGSVEEGKVSFDTTSVQAYLEPDFIFDGGWGYNNFEPVFKYETAFGYVLGVHQFYTPGAFGIYNTYFKIYTFDKEGKQLDSDEIGCFCYDSNLGANDYYQTDLDCRFMEGQIEVKAIHTHETLFEYEPGESDYDPNNEFFSHVNEENYTVLIKETGEIIVPEP